MRVVNATRMALQISSDTGLTILHVDLRASQLQSTLEGEAQRGRRMHRACTEGILKFATSLASVGTFLRQVERSTDFRRWYTVSRFDDRGESQ